MDEEKWMKGCKGDGLNGCVSGVGGVAVEAQLWRVNGSSVGEGRWRGDGRIGCVEREMERLWKTPLWCVKWMWWRGYTEKGSGREVVYKWKRWL